ncbi:peptidoglycan-binding protein [Oscillospiraceae bacterium OttesenSCG-928-G22]|nr:peptidoglycan-binding protein [Oscillospiraceae bacterium OttesenSCG-928-G22]
MATVYIYNNQTNWIETYYLGEESAMPYAGPTLKVKEFRGASRATVLYSDRRFMETWRNFRAYYGRPISVGYAFKRIWEGGHAAQSQHYAGGSFDAGQNLTAAGRNTLRNSAVSFGGWSYVEPASLTPTWVHFDRRLTPPACSTGGFPLVRQGSRGVYVFIMQDALNALGYTGGGFDGMFGGNTRAALIRYQRANGLSQDGVCGCNTWRRLTSQAVGIGRTATVAAP